MDVKMYKSLCQTSGLKWRTRIEVFKYLLIWAGWIIFLIFKLFLLKESDWGVKDEETKYNSSGMHINERDGNHPAV